MTNKKALIVYHQTQPGIDCPDGICGAWVVYKGLTSKLLYKDNEIEVVGDSYLKNDDYELESYTLPFNPNDYDEVILVDFSYPEKILRQIATEVRLTVLDHHKTRMGDISAVADLILGGYSAEDCGASFAWKHYFKDEPAPWFIKHVRRRDIGADGYYDEKTPESEAITEAIAIHRLHLKGKEAFYAFDNLRLVTEETLKIQGEPLIAYRDNLVNEALNQYNGALIKVGEYTVPYYHLTNKEAHRHYSIIGSKAASRHFKEGYDFIAITTDNPLQISLRACKESTVSVGDLAKSLGGGGHDRAAGYIISPHYYNIKSKINSFLFEFKDNLDREFLNDMHVLVDMGEFYEAIHMTIGYLEDGDIEFNRAQQKQINDIYDSILLAN